MAFMRCLSTRRSLIGRRCQLSLSYILRNDEDDCRGGGISGALQERYFGIGFKNPAAVHVVGFLGDKKCMGFGISSVPGVPFRRCMSTMGTDGTDKIELMSKVADAFTDTTAQDVAMQAPSVNEVAVAAADSFAPVWAIQHLIDAVHAYTGLNWWASIIVTTLLIRAATLPLSIKLTKSTSKFSLMMPHLENILREMQEKGMDPIAIGAGNHRMNILFKKYGVSLFTPLKGLFIQGPIFVSFFLATFNMAEKVPSFKTGGAYWFIDLSAPDTLYIFPILTGLSFLIIVECNMLQGMDGSRMKQILRALAVVSVPLTLSFPQAIFCHCVTSNLFSLVYGLVLKAPGVKKALGVPEISVAPEPSTSSSLFSALEQYLAAKQKGASPWPGGSSPNVAQKRVVSLPSVPSQRVKSLEEKRNKKRKKR